MFRTIAMTSAVAGELAGMEARHATDVSGARTAVFVWMEVP